MRVVRAAVPGIADARRASAHAAGRGAARRRRRVAALPADGRDARDGRRALPGRDEAGRDPDQHRARRAGRRGGAGRGARERHLGGVGLDVLSVEPPPADHPLLRPARAVGRARRRHAAHRLGRDRGAPPARGRSRPTTFARSSPASARTASTDDASGCCGLGLAEQRDDDRARAAADRGARRGRSPARCPSASRPPRIGTVTAGPTSSDLMCAGMSSGPSVVCSKYGAFSGTARENQRSMSPRTSGSAFSLIDERRRRVLDEEVRQPDVERARARARAATISVVTR